jgi:glycosyltransferase involved in cell wall biosynthesis
VTDAVKLIVQIPCYNEEQTLREVVAGMPRRLEGIDAVEVLIVDDGSSDRTAAVAQELGVDHIVRHTSNRGLARSFRSGLDACLAHGADTIVNTDGDNQYDSRDIPLLIQPILDGTADIVIGDRETHAVQHFSPLKRRLQRLGSKVVGTLSGTSVPDAVSGFRAISREAALQLNIVSPFSYTIEMLIQAGHKRLAVSSVPIRVNRPTRPSRLFRSLPQFIARSVGTMVRIFAMYRPLATFVTIGALLFIAGAIPILRFLYFFVRDGGAGHLQSLILGGVLVVLGCVTLLVGLVADLINFNRRLIELTLEKVRRLETRHSLEESSARRTGAATDRRDPRLHAGEGGR